MNIYRYKIELNIEGETKFETGIVCAESLVRVIEEVAKYFGNNFVAFHMLKMIGVYMGVDSPFICLDEGVINEVEERWIYNE